ncbi:MAG: DUF3137 domain-containing protein [Cyanobacteria bacterium SIG30]|nr:DUF3137 domain-containing protein [Cyanobacteria bacterium SIG30]
MLTRREFINKFYSEIVPILEPLEQKRKRYRIKNIKTVLKCLASGTISMVLGILLFKYKEASSDPTLATIATILCGSGFALWCFLFESIFSKISKFETEIKNQIMPTICSYIGDIEWKKRSRGYANGVRESQLIRKYDYQYCDEVFTGSYKDIPYVIAEVLFTEKGNKGEYPVFRGIIIKIDVNKEFNSHTLIMPTPNWEFRILKGLERTQLDNINFEKKYNVFTNNEVEARYLITPTFMERLNTIKMAFFARRIRCAFHNGNLLIALNSRRDVFSIGKLYSTILNIKPYLRMYEEIASIINLIEHLKMYDKSGV